MSIFRSIMSKIFGHPAAASTADAGSPTPGTTSSGGIGSLGGAAATPSTPAAGQAPAASGQNVDVQAVLTDMASKNSQQLNWQTSIVDLMKLLDLDSSLAARKELAGELGYTGSTDDSASMNIWLHKQVMNKLAANGGKVPADLRD